MAFKSSNPVFGARFFSEHGKDAEAMTLQGTLNKTFILFGFVLLSAIPLYFWASTPEVILSGSLRTATLGAGFATMALGAFITFGGQQNLKILAPIYALLQGVFVGVSTGLLNTLFPGVAFQAVTLTLGVLFLMLGLFRTGIIQPTERFKAAVAAGVGAFAIYYTINLFFNLFSGHNILTFGSTFSIGVSALAVVMASLSLILDFSAIQEGIERGAPKRMEWYGAFGLMVTIVWLYIEMLRLLAQLQSRR